MHARPIRSSLGPDPNGSSLVCTGPKTPELHKARDVMRVEVYCLIVLLFSPIQTFISVSVVILTMAHKCKTQKSIHKAKSQYTKLNSDTQNLIPIHKT